MALFTSGFDITSRVRYQVNVLGILFLCLIVSLTAQSLWRMRTVWRAWPVILSILRNFSNYLILQVEIGDTDPLVFTGPHWSGRVLLTSFPSPLLVASTLPWPLSLLQHPFKALSDNWDKSFFCFCKLWPLFVQWPSLNTSPCPIKVWMYCPCT